MLSWESEGKFTSARRTGRHRDFHHAAARPQLKLKLLTRECVGFNREVCKCIR